jgi:hypothetical protein
VTVGARDALLCADHALFALDSDVSDLAELRELHEFIETVEPSPDEVAVRGRRAGYSERSRTARSA